MAERHDATPGLRVVLFTGHADIESSPWWSVLASIPGLAELLICRQLPAPGSGAGKRFWKNVRKHGPLWIPYRLGYALLDRLRRLGSSHEIEIPPARMPARVERVEVAKLASSEAVDAVTRWKPDLGVSISAPILKPELFTVPRLGTINVHEGAVPEFRGAPPGFWELYFGASEIGATAHWVDAGLDTGKVIAEERAPIYPADTLEELQARAFELGRSVLGRAFALVATGDASGVPQRSGGRTNRIPLLKFRLRLATRRGLARLAKALRPRQLAKLAGWLFVLGIYRPLRDLVRTLRGQHPLHVFTFHRVTTLCRDGMTVSPAVLARQIRYIRKTHDILTLQEALALARNGDRRVRPAALLTFDDGYESVFAEAMPILANFGATGCSFVSTDLVETDRRLPHDADSPVRALMPVMSWDQVRALKSGGWWIGSHSASHARLSAVSGDALRHEVEGSLAALRARLGDVPAAMAYPYGGRADISEEARGLIRASGYLACFNDVFGENHCPCDPFDIARIEIGGDHPTLAWKCLAHGVHLRELGLGA